MNALSPVYRAQCFGLLWQSDIKLVHFADALPSMEAVNVVVCETRSLAQRNPINRINRGFVYADGFRFAWDDIVTFDVFGGNRIEYCVGPKWTGSLPWPFFSTVVALLLAWRGGLPFHGSAVSIEGKGVLICGESGAGKSSLTAALIAEGASFVSDDLSMAVPDPDNADWNLVIGRPGIRLFPTVGRWFFGDDTLVLPDDLRNKVIAIPAMKSTDEGRVRLCHIIFLGGPIKSMTAIDQFFHLRKNLFRPNWLSQLPVFSAIKVAVRDISASTRIGVEPAIGETDEQILRGRARAIIDMVRSTE